MSALIMGASIIGKALVPLLGKAVVKLVEKVHGRDPLKPEQGPAKKFDAVSLFRRLLAAVQQEVPGLGMPEGEEIGNLIEAFHAELKAAGELRGVDTVVDTPVLLGPRPAPQHPSVLVADSSSVEPFNGTQERAAGLAERLRAVADELDGLKGEYLKDLAAVSRVKVMLERRESALVKAIADEARRSSVDPV